MVESTITRSCKPSLSVKETLVFPALLEFCARSVIGSFSSRTACLFHCQCQFVPAVSLKGKLVQTLSLCLKEQLVFRAYICVEFVRDFVSKQLRLLFHIMVPHFLGLFFHLQCCCSVALMDFICIFRRHGFSLVYSIVHRFSQEPSLSQRMIYFSDNHHGFSRIFRRSGDFLVYAVGFYTYSAGFGLHYCQWFFHLQCRMRFSAYNAWAGFSFSFCRVQSSLLSVVIFTYSAECGIFFLLILIPLMLDSFTLVDIFPLNGRPLRTVFPTYGLAKMCLCRLVLVFYIQWQLFLS